MASRAALTSPSISRPRRARRFRGTGDSLEHDERTSRIPPQVAQLDVLLGDRDLEGVVGEAEPDRRHEGASVVAARRQHRGEGASGGVRTGYPHGASPVVVGNPTLADRRDRSGDFRSFPPGEDAGALPTGHGIVALSCESVRLARGPSA
jgi:hypothetical protein